MTGLGIAAVFDLDGEMAAESGAGGATAPAGAWPFSAGTPGVEAGDFGTGSRARWNGRAGRRWRGLDGAASVDRAGNLAPSSDSAAPTQAIDVRNASRAAAERLPWSSPSPGAAWLTRVEEALRRLRSEREEAWADRVDEMISDEPEPPVWHPRRRSLLGPNRGQTVASLGDGGQLAKDCLALRPQPPRLPPWPPPTR